MVKSIDYNVNEIYQNRISYLDFAKGLGMCMVIFGHMGFEQSKNEFVRFFTMGITSFHMPLFFFISGMLLSVHYDSYTLFVKKSKTLLKPYVYTAICILTSLILKYFLVHGFGALNNVYPYILAFLYGSGTGSHTPFGIQGCSSIWFLWALFWSTIITNFVLKKDHQGVIIVGIFLLGIVSRNTIDFYLPFSIQSGLVSCIYVYVGYLTKKHGLFSNNIDNNWFKYLMIAIGIIWLFVEYNSTNKLVLATADLGSIKDFIASFAAIYIYIYIYA